MKTLFFILLLSASATAQSWLLQDVSLLFPRATKSMGVKTEGKLGVLIPAYALARLPVLEPSLRRETQGQFLEVVGVRIDPPEVRLVWGVFGSTGALDLAVHTFYRMKDERGFLTELKKLSLLSRKDVRPGLPLSVHPTLAREGMDGAYGVALKNLFLSSIGEQNLFKITFMNMTLAHMKWDFGGFTVADGKTQNLVIPKLKTDRVQVFINDSVSSSFSGGMGPAPIEQDFYNRLISDTSKAQVSEPQALAEAHGSANRFENPTLENSGTMDCVSCHLAQPVREWTETAEPRLTQAPQNLYMNQAFNLKNMSRDRKRTDNLRAFGWFEDAPSVNQRAINESAFVAAKLNLSSYR